MALEGLHHVTAITGDAQGNVDFYAGTLGLRLVKKTVNFDAPDVYHLYFGDEAGTPGSILTFFEFPGARQGRAGAGMVHRILWRVGSPDALDFWEQRLEGARREGDALVFADPEGLEHELVVAGDLQDRPLVAAAAGIPPEHALQGFHGVRAYAVEPERSAPLLRRIGFAGGEDGAWELAGDERRATLRYDAPPAAAGIQAAGTVHHVAWSAADDAELSQTGAVARDAGAQPTPIIDRQYFHSVYFREPSGVLFELASRDIGFEADEPRETLGEALRLPPQHEHLRERLEATLTPLVNPRSAAGAPSPHR
jgi:glyoxalase family protein